MNFSPIRTDPRQAAIENHARQDVNNYISPFTRAVRARRFEVQLVELLCGQAMSAADLAEIDQRNQEGLYLEDVRNEALRCFADPSLTASDFVDPDPNATRPYTRPSIWTSPPWQAARTNKPVVSGNYNLAEKDLGVVLNQAGSVCYLPAYTGGQLGMEYMIKNGSTGLVGIQAAQGEGILVRGQLVTAHSFDSDLSRQLSRETTTQHWIIS